MIHYHRIGTIAQTRVNFFKLYDAPVWLVSLILHIDAREDQDARGRYPTSVPQAHATVDDFGNLVLVTGWR